MKKSFFTSLSSQFGCSLVDSLATSLIIFFTVIQRGGPMPTVPLHEQKKQPAKSELYRQNGEY